MGLLSDHGQSLHNLGDLTEFRSLLVFGGCYSNFEATEALKFWAEQHGFSPEQIICTGDIVAYAANPVETVDLVRSWGVHCIQGNVEESLAENIDHCGCGFDEGSTCDVLSKGWFPYADKRVSVPQRQWFASLPQQMSFSFAGKQCRVVHGAVSEISRFMFASQNDQDFLEEMQQIDVVIAGHSGLPFTKMIADKVWHNSGALGMPANDGSQQVWFSVLALDEHEQITVEHRALSYDANAAQTKMIEAGLTQGYHQALSNGLWPSMDVLPLTEKNAVGIELKPYTTTVIKR